MYKAPRYLPAAGKQALVERLSSLAAANVPSVCPVYAGLARPSNRSPEHAEVTYAIAESLAAGAAELLPTFNTSPSPALRVLTAASWGRVDAILADFDGFPADLASKLWWRVKCMTEKRRALPLADLSTACNLLTRLGYQARAAWLLGLADVGIMEHSFHPQLVRAEFSALHYLCPDAVKLESRALKAAGDHSLPAHERLAMAIFVIVSNGKRGSETPAMRQAVELAGMNLEEFTAPLFEWQLARHRLFRATSYLPFVRGDATETFHQLDQAAKSLEAAIPGRRLEELAWNDHAYPMYETLAKTSILLGDAEQAVAASERLIGISQHDHRTWDTRGRSFLAAGRLAEALDAYEQAIPLGGLPVGEAAYHAGWINEQLGNVSGAREAYALSLRVDPTVQVVRDRVAALGSGA